MVPAIVDRFGEGLDDVDAESPDGAFGNGQIEIGRFRVDGIERDPVVGDVDGQHAAVERQRDADRVCAVAGLAVLDDVGHDFVEHQVDVHHHVVREVMVGAEALNEIGEAHELLAFVTERDGKGRHDSNATPLHIQPAQHVGRGLVELIGAADVLEPVQQIVGAQPLLLGAAEVVDAPRRGAS